MSESQFDIVILGGGPGGYATALYARNFGLSVALVEEERPGGTCLLRGCIPAKQWLQVAEVFSTVRHADAFGVLTSEPELDWSAALARKDRVVDQLVTGLSGLLRKRGVEVVTGRGRLSGPGRIELEGGEKLEGRAVVVATGSHAMTIPGWEIDGERIVTSDHAEDWKSRPDRVAIIGGGVIGCEFASLLVDLGAEVSVFELERQLIPGGDADASRQLQRQLGRRGVKFYLKTGVGPAEVGDDGVKVSFRDKFLEVDVALVAVGRGPNTDGIGLETVRAEVERGYIKVDPVTMETAEPGVYAVGDVVAATPQLAHAAFAEGIAAATYIATGEPAPVDYRSIPRVTYTHPEVAEVGISAADAQAAGMEVEVTKHPFGGVGRALIIGQSQGMVKVVAEKNGPLVGAAVVGPQAGEMIHELMFAVGWEALPEEAATFIHAHPTLSEAVGETLLSATGRSLH
ncbi:MAG: dihydrolipoyl dehydrogenase [Acidimicrobiia bacterium]|nr:dihydrolipoyl dehydrogenase [Acidimicrobiia bacterium]